MNVTSGIVAAELFKLPIVDPLRFVAEVSNPDPPTIATPLLALVLSVFVVTCAAPVWMVQRLAPNSRSRAVAVGLLWVRFNMLSLSTINQRKDRSENPDSKTIGTLNNAEIL